MFVAPSESQTPVPGQGDLHRVLGEVAGGVRHVLVRRGDLKGRRVVVGSKVRGQTAAAAGLDEGEHIDPSPLIEDRLRRLDHDLEAQAPAGSFRPRSSRSKRSASAQVCSGTVTLGSVTTKFSGSRPACVEERGQKDVERAHAAALQLLGERLDPDADRRRKRSRRQARRDLARRLRRVSVLFGVRAISVAVLEVDPEVLDGLAAQFLEDALGDFRGEPSGQARRRRRKWRRPARIPRAPAGRGPRVAGRCRP